MVSDSNLTINPNSTIHVIPEDIRNIAKYFGLCFYNLKTNKNSISNHSIMHQIINEPLGVIIPHEKRLRGGIVYHPNDETVYAFGEYKQETMTQKTINNIPNLDDSSMGDSTIDFVEVPLNELENYLKTVFAEHYNNDRKSAVIDSAYIRELQKLN